MIPCQYRHRWYGTSLKVQSLGYISVVVSIGVSSTTFTYAPESYRSPWNNENLGLLSRSKSFKVTDFGTNRKLVCDFLLLININLPPILHRFPDIAFDRSKSLYMATPLAFNPPTEGFPWHDLCKILPGCQRWPRTKWNITENFKRLSRVPCTNATNRRQIDGFRTTCSERER